MANYTAEFNERLAELQSHWKKAATAAKEVGYEKPDDSSWDEAALEIAKLEFERDGKLITMDEGDPESWVTAESKVEDDESWLIPETKLNEDIPMSEEEAIEKPKPCSTGNCDISASTKSAKVQGQYATEYYKKNGIPHCNVCGELFLLDLDGKPMCAEGFTSDVCPRLGGE